MATKETHPSNRLLREIRDELRAMNKKLGSADVAGLNRKLDQLLLGEKKMAGELDTLTTQVKNNTDAEQAAIQLIQGLADRIANAGTDPAKLQALSDELKSSADALGAAVVANTPAAPPA